MSSIFKNINQSKRRIRSPRRINAPTLPLLTYLVENSHVFSTRFSPPTHKKTKTTKKVFSIDKCRDETKIFKQQISTSLSRKKKKILLKSNTSTTGGMVIMPTNVFRKKNRSQKTSVSLGNLHANDCS